MPTVFRCPHGHAWEDLFNDPPSSAEGRPVCPVCATPPDGTPPRQAPSANGATAVVPVLAGEEPARAAGVSVRGGGVAWADDTVVDDGWPAVPGYELLGELGRGGMGVVYKARQVELNRVVALKMILAGSAAGDRDRARFRTEAQAVARLQHPNIVQIYDVGEHDGRAYFSLEFVGGGSLAERLQGAPLTAAQAARLVETLARAMHFAHEHGVVHRDLKPANILLPEGAGPAPEAASRSGATSRRSHASGDGGWVTAVKVTDFGLAKQLDTDVEHTRSGTVVGTPAYMAPEQAQGRGRELGPRTDVYALGVILYQTLAGRPPFVGETALEVLLKVAHDEPVPPSRLAPRVPRDLETICLKCLEKEPRRRYASAAALADDLTRFLNHEPILARPVRVWERGLRWARRRPLTAALLAAVGLALLGLAGTTAAEHRRRAAARAEMHGLALQGREAADNHAWDKARDRLERARDKAEGEGLLAELPADVAELLTAAGRQLDARRTYQEFVRLRDEALYLAVLTANTRSPGKLAATRAKLREALARAGVEGPPAEPKPFTAAEKADLQAGCYDLLLALAEAVAQSPAGSTPEAQRANARAALRVLDRAPELGLHTHAYHLRRARYLRQAGDPVGACAEYAQAALRPAATALDHYLLGGEHYRRDDPRAARAELVESLRLNPRDFWARFYLAMCYVRLYRSEEPHYDDLARDSLTSCARQRPEAIGVYLLRGFVHGRLKDYAAAEADFRRSLGLLKKHPDDEVMYALLNNRAVVCVYRKKLGAAEQDLRAAIALRPKRYEAYLTLGVVYREQKLYGDALAWFGKALAAAHALEARQELRGRTLAILFFERYRVHAARHDLDAALADLDEVVARQKPDGPLLARAHRERGAQLARAQRLAEAVQAYDDALAVERDLDTQRYRANLLLALREYADAAEGYDRYLADGGPGTPEVYRNRGLARANLADHPAALADFTQAVRLAPQDVKLRECRGQSYLATGAYDLALPDFDAAVRGAPNSAEARLGRGLARVQLGRYADGVADAEQAVRLAPKDARTAFHAARLVAQAAGQVAAGPRGLDRRAEGARRRYQARAGELLGRALALLPEKERAPFWDKTARDDPSLAPIQATPAFVRLEQLYSRGKK